MNSKSRSRGLSLGYLSLACSVCYGNPSSALVKGASAGALFLIGIVALVLTGIAATILTWSRRAARLERQVRPSRSVRLLRSLQAGELRYREFTR